MPCETKGKNDERNAGKERTKGLFCLNSSSCFCIPFVTPLRTTSDTHTHKTTKKKNTTMMWCGISTLTTAALILMMSRSSHGADWMDYGEMPATLDTAFDDESDQFLSALTRDQEQESHSAFITGYKYVSGGAGEGRQHLSPGGQIPNRPEVKTDEELPAYCHPPNPCPLGFEAEDCDASPMSTFTAEYSRLYQNGQDCQCDSDHDECAPDSIVYDTSMNSASGGVLKRSRRVRRVRTPGRIGQQEHSHDDLLQESARQQEGENGTKAHPQRHSSHKGQTLRFHVAKKSPVSLTS